LTDGGQPPEDTAHALAAWIGAAERTLDIAIYDLHLPDELAAIVKDALVGAVGRGVAVRLVYNLEETERLPVPPPSRAEPELLDTLPFPTASIPGSPDLMHHKYVVRDGEAVWT